VCRCDRALPREQALAFSVDVDETDSAADERQRAGVREAAGLGRRDVDDDAYARLDELFRRHAIDVSVIDDGDVVRRQAFDELLRHTIELCVTGELDEAHVLVPTVARNSRPPSMR
jgi:hypothetical protein